MKRVWIGFVTATALTAAGTTLWSEHSSWLIPATASTTEYVFHPVDQGDIAATVVASGTLAAVSTVVVGTQVSGQIARVLADFNTEVRRGSVVAEIDPVPFQNAVDQAKGELAVAMATVNIQRSLLDKAKADLESSKAALTTAAAWVERARLAIADAQRDLDRKRTLGARTLDAIVSPVEMQKAQTAVDIAVQSLKGSEGERALKEAQVIGAESFVRSMQAQVEYAQARVARDTASLKQAQTLLDRTKIRSPTDGVVINRAIEEGQTVASSLQSPTLFTIAQDLREMQINISVDEADIGKVTEGQPVIFTVDSFPGHKFEGRVRQVRKNAQTVQNVVTYVVVASAPNPDLILLPGMTANARILIAQRTNVGRVPMAALRFRPVGSTAPAHAHVWTLDDGTLLPVKVKTGLSDGNMIEVIQADHTLDRVIIGVDTKAPTTVPRRIIGSM